MKLRLLVVLVVFLTSSISYSQVNEEIKEKLRNQWNQSVGSFQFQIINSRVQPSVNVEIIEEIEANRDENRIVYIDYAESIRIKILPKSAIKGEYKKLELFTYITL